MPVNTGWTGGQYSLFRALFGSYLAIHFAALLPYGAELFSDRGVLPRAEASPLAWLFPNLLTIFDPPRVVTVMLATAVALSLMLVTGWRDRAAAVGIWYVLACLFGRNPLIANPSLPYVGWMLLAHACLPSGPYGSVTARTRADLAGAWRFPRSLHTAAWIVMAVGYSYSGYMKLASPSWVDGSALAYVLSNPLARPSWLRDALLALPPFVLQTATWGALAAELLYAPLALSRRLRPWVWLAMLGMHLALLALVDFADLSFGMVLLHLFTFDPGWVAPAAAPARDTVYFDGRNGLCRGFVQLVLAESPDGAAVLKKQRSRDGHPPGKYQSPSRVTGAAMQKRGARRVRGQVARGLAHSNSHRFRGAPHYLARGPGALGLHRLRSRP